MANRTCYVVHCIVDTCPYRFVGKSMDLERHSCLVDLVILNEKVMPFQLVLSDRSNAHGNDEVVAAWHVV